MNALAQLKNGFLGTQEAVESLAKSDAARLLVVSDTHGHYAVLEAIVREFGPTCDALLFSGDGMWDIVQYLENALDSERIKEALPPVVAFVAGNGDGDQYRVSLPVRGVSNDPEDAPGFTIDVPSRQILHACGYSVLLVHGHRYSVDVNLEVLVDTAHIMACDIVVFGHTHVPFAETFAHILALNPGSASRPRGRSDSGFAIIELEAHSTEPSHRFYTVSEGILGTFHFSER
jgi:uncharacterized protein